MRLTPASLARHSPCALTVNVGAVTLKDFEADALVLFCQRRGHIAELPFAPDQFLGVKIDGRNGMRIASAEMLAALSPLTAVESAESPASGNVEMQSVELQAPRFG